MGLTEDLEKIKALEPDEDFDTVSEQIINAASSTLKWLISKGLQEPDKTISGPSGNIIAEWHGSDGEYFEIEFEPECNKTEGYYHSDIMFVEAGATDKHFKKLGIKC